MVCIVVHTILLKVVQSGRDALWYYCMLQQKTTQCAAQHHNAKDACIQCERTLRLWPRPGSHLGLHSRLDLAPKRLESRLSHHLMTRLDLKFSWLKSATWTPVLLKFALKVTNPTFRAQRFRPVSAHSASTVIASDKSSISTNRKSDTRFSTSHRWTIYLSPPEGGSKREFLHFALHFTSSLQVVVDTSHLVYGLNIASPNYR